MPQANVDEGTMDNWTRLPCVTDADGSSAAQASGGGGRGWRTQRGLSLDTEVRGPGMWRGLAKWATAVPFSCRQVFTLPSNSVNGQGRASHGRFKWDESPQPQKNDRLWSLSGPRPSRHPYPAPSPHASRLSPTPRPCRCTPVGQTGSPRSTLPAIQLSMCDRMWAIISHAFTNKTKCAGKMGSLISPRYKNAEGEERGCG